MKLSTDASCPQALAQTSCCPNRVIYLHVFAHCDGSCCFSCTRAGIATNKLLSKVGSARNKPDKQTLVLPRGVADLMAVRQGREWVWR